MFEKVVYIKGWCTLFFSLLLLVSCGGGAENASVSCSGDTLAMRHSTLLQLVDCDSFVVAEIKNPWRKGLLQRYLLVPSGCDVPAGMPQGTLLRTPLKNTLLFSGIHANLFKQFGAAAAVKGVCDARYIIQPWLQAMLSSGNVVDCGSSLDVNVERVVQLSPDAIFAFPFENGGYGKIDKLKYPVVECAEYMESSPLGAAEWMRFYGRLLGCGAMADSLYSVVCENFEQLRSAVAGCSVRPTLMCELKSSSAWYVPAAGSTMGQMYQMAGADYLFAENKGQGSVPLSYETVLARAANAGFWLLKYNSSVDKSRKTLLEEFKGYAHFAPFKNGNIYACNTARKPLFEETAFRPDWLLAELVTIFHPALSGQKELRYYERMP